tara:strand:- start:1844 stop:2218 length:375 start_codon:yes stop_codon:yes gene_type:complete
MSDNAALVIELDRARMGAMVQGDVLKLSDMLCESLVYTHSTSRIDSKSSLVGDIASGDTVYNSVIPSEVNAQDLGDTVVLTGVAQMSVTRNGNLNEFSARFSDVYQNQNGTWRMVTWQSTKIPT